jgi:hypothetical protein
MLIQKMRDVVLWHCELCRRHILSIFQTEFEAWPDCKESRIDAAHETNDSWSATMMPSRHYRDVANKHVDIV